MDVLVPQPGHITSALVAQHGAAAGQYIHRRNRHQFPIPGRLNLTLVAAQVATAFAILTVASHTRNPWLIAAMAIAFAFAMQMGFCLAHEAVHRKLHPNRNVNLSVGLFMFSLFPGSFHFFEVAHLIHHRRNRSDDELEDYVLPGENAVVKRGMYYLLISGLFWMLLVLSSIVIAFIPVNRISLPRPADDAGAFRKFIQFLNDIRPSRVRRDLVAAIVTWTAASFLLHLRLSSVLICYAAFAFSWASQQYIYHVRTPRHAVLGALDLKLWKPLQMLYLHFNYHLTHHLAVWVPWIHLPDIAPQQPERGYLKTYAHLWRPPQRLEQAWPENYQTSGPLAAPPRSKAGLSLPALMPLEPLPGIAIREATVADNDALLALTRATPMAGRIALRIDREPDFFALLRARGEAILFVAIHEERIIGCMSAAVYPAFIEGAIERIAHVGDLKVHPDFGGRRLALHLVSAIEHYLRSIGIDLSFNLVADGNHKVMTIALGKHGTPIQVMLGRFFVNELLPSPFRRRDPRYTIAQATRDDLPAIATMRNDFARVRNFARPTTLADVEHRFDAAPAELLVVRHNAIPVATLTVEDTQHLRRNVPVGLPFHLRAAVNVFRLIPGLRIPRLGQPLAILYVRHMACAEHHEAALKPLIAEARAIAFARRATFLSVGLHERDPLRSAVAGLTGFTFTSRAMATSLLTPGRVTTLADRVPYEDFALV